MFTKMKSLCLTFVLFLGIHVLQAQNQDAAWSLQKCVDYALANNISIKQTRYTVNSTNVSLTQYKMGRYPTVNASWSYGFSYGTNLNYTTYQYEKGEQQYSQPSLNLSLPIFKGLSQQYYIKQYSKELQATKLDIETSQNTVSLNLVNYYLQILNYSEQLEVAKNQVSLSNITVERMEKLVKSGSKADYELLDAKSQLANDELTLVTAQNNLDLAKLYLQQQMNLPYTNTFEVEKVLIPEVNYQNYGTASKDIYEIAQNNQPNVKAADLRIESSSYSLAAARGTLYPTISINGSLGTQYSNLTQKTLGTENVVYPIGYVQGTNQQVLTSGTQRITGKWDILGQYNNFFNQYIGINVNIPILNAWQARGRVANAAINKEKAKLNSQDTRVKLRQSIEEAYTNMLLSSKKYDSYKKQVESLEASFKAMQTRYDVGVANFLEYSTSKNNLSKAQSNLVQAKYDYVFRTKILDFYQNKPLIF